MLGSQCLRQTNNWKEFRSRLEHMTEKKKGDCFEFFTKCYLQLDSTYATKLKNVWLLREVPTSVREKLRLPDVDEGIDLIAETKESGLWAIQCKYFSDESRSLNRRNLSTSV